MNRNNSSRLVAPAAPTQPLTGPGTKDVQEALGVAHDAAGANYFQSKLIQPAYDLLTFVEGNLWFSNQNPILNVDWDGSWTVQSILLVNPNNWPIYVGAGADPTESGVPFPPLQTLRLPMAGNNGAFTFGCLESDVDIFETQFYAHLFRFPTPD